MPARNERKEGKRSSSSRERNARKGNTTEYFTGTDGALKIRTAGELVGGGLYREGYPGRELIEWMPLSLSLEILLPAHLFIFGPAPAEAGILLIRNGASFPSYLEINYFLSP